MSTKRLGQLRLSTGLAVGLLESLISDRDYKTLATVGPILMASVRKQLYVLQNGQLEQPPQPAERKKRGRKTSSRHNEPQPVRSKLPAAPSPHTEALPS